MNLRVNYFLLANHNIFASHKVSKILKTLLHIFLLVLVKILSSDGFFFNSSPSSSNSNSALENTSRSRTRRSAEPMSMENPDALYSRFCTYYFQRLDDKNGIKEVINHPILRSTFTLKVDEECEPADRVGGEMQENEAVVEV